MHVIDACDTSPLQDIAKQPVRGIIFSIDTSNPAWFKFFLFMTQCSVRVQCLAQHIQHIQHP